MQRNNNHSIEFNKITFSEKLETTNCSIIMLATWQDKTVVVKQYQTKNELQKNALRAELKFLPKLMETPTHYFVACYGFAWQFNTCYAVFEYMENRALDEYIDAHKKQHKK